MEYKKNISYYIVGFAGLLFFVFLACTIYQYFIGDLLQAIFFVLCALFAYEVAVNSVPFVEIEKE